VSWKIFRQVFFKTVAKNFWKKIPPKASAGKICSKKYRIKEHPKTVNCKQTKIKNNSKQSEIAYHLVYT